MSLGVYLCVCISAGMCLCIVGGLLCGDVCKCVFVWGLCEGSAHVSVCQCVHTVCMKSLCVYMCVCVCLGGFVHA